MKNLILVGTVVAGFLGFLAASHAEPRGRERLENNQSSATRQPAQQGAPRNETPAKDRNVIDSTDGTLKDTKDKMGDHQQKATDVVDQMEREEGGIMEVLIEEAQILEEAKLQRRVHETITNLCNRSKVV